MQLLSLISQNENEKAAEKAKEFGWLRMKEEKLIKSLERIEFEEKLELLNLKKPW